MATEPVATFPDNTGSMAADTPSTSAPAGGLSHTTSRVSTTISTRVESKQNIAKQSTQEQLQAAKAYLENTTSDRAEASRELEDEAKLFMDSTFTAEQEELFRVIFQLVRSQVRTYTRNMESILQEKLASLARVQGVMGDSEEDADRRSLVTAVSKGKIVEAEIRVIERGLVAMRELNGRSGASKRTLTRSSRGGWKKIKQEAEAKTTTAKRSRLPAAAVKDMRTWLDKHWDDPVPTHEEKAEFAQRHEITTKQVENWFINIRMREWRPAMRRALDHAEETGSYAEFSRLLQHTADGNVFKKFLEEREMGNNSTLVPPPSLQRFIGAEGFAAFVGDSSVPKRPRC